MDPRQSFSAWQDVAKYRAARKMIQGGAWGRLIFGVIAVFAGLLSFQLDIIHVGLVVLGGYLVAGFVVAFARPGVAAWILGGTGLVLLGLWNVLYTFADVILYKDKGQAQTFWAVLGAFQILWGARLLLTKSRYVGIHLPAIRQREMYVHLEQAAGAMMTARRLHHHAACGGAAETLFERFDMLLDLGTNVRRGGHPLELDLNWRLHEGSARAMELRKHGTSKSVELRKACPA